MPPSMLGFLNLLSPLINEARLALQEEIVTSPVESAGSSLPKPVELEGMLFSGVQGILKQIITPTLALELNVARLQGELQGATSEQRYDHYIHRLAYPVYAGALIAEYPALFNLAAERLDVWIDVSMELIGRLATDWDDIVANFFRGESPGLLEDLRFAQRTTKRGGRGVVVLTFSSGAKLVYKPRSLAIESRFQELLGWLNRAGFEPEFRIINLLDRETHGWMEWIDPAGCETVDELQRFYRRQGAYLALFYALEATDLHMSNVIAAGEHPLLIDLEALFHPRDAVPDWPALDLALDDLAYYSVTRSGLLPEPESAGEDTPELFDLSGLAGAGGQLTPYLAPTWRNNGTDHMRLERERRVTGGGNNRPVLGKKMVDPLDYLESLDTGFTEAYRLLVAHRDEILAAGGWLARFDGLEVRAMPRSGRRYGAILESSFHPDLMRDPAARPRFLTERLRQDAADEPDLARLVHHETADMLLGDVPLFTTRSNSRDLYTSRGVRIPDMFAHSGMEMARRRIAALDEADLARQRWFIRASFATLAAGRPDARRRVTLAAKPPANLSVRALAEARAIGERLERSAVRAGEEASWLGLEPDDDDHWSLEPLGHDLADGLPGVALFLAHLGARTGERRWSDLAQAAEATFLRYEIEDDEAAELATPIGLFGGLGGRLYALSHLAAFERKSRLRRPIKRLIDRAGYFLCNLVVTDTVDEEPGLAHGLAGCLTGLLVAHQATAEPVTVIAARLAGDLLLTRLDAAPDDLPVEPFASFFHRPVGAAGPLLALAETTHRDSYRVMAEALLAETVAAGNQDAGFWWAYLFARPRLRDVALRHHLDASLKGALMENAGEGLGHNHSLFGGALGHASLLVEASTALDDADLSHCASRYAATVLDDIAQNGPLTAIPLHVESPGLASGLAGIGYGLLRLAAPRQTPFLPAIGLPLGGNR